MKRILVWDFSTRLLHWLFAGATVAAMGIAMTVDDDSAAFQLHMMFGLVAGIAVVLRLIWGFDGTRYARFGSFLFGPKALAEYLKGAMRRNADRYVGHSPGSAYAVYLMWLLGLGLALSGLFMSTSKVLEEAHEAMAFALFLTAATHIAGIVWHTIRHKENIARSMIDGKKEGKPRDAIASNHVGIGMAFLVVAATWSAIVFSGHDLRAGQLTLFGQTFRLGESEHARRGRHGGEADGDDHERRDTRRGERGHHSRDRDNDWRDSGRSRLDVDGKNRGAGGSHHSEQCPAVLTDRVNLCRPLDGPPSCSFSRWRVLPGARRGAAVARITDEERQDRAHGLGLLAQRWA